MSDNSNGGSNGGSNDDTCTEQQRIIRAEVDLLNRACMLIDCPEFAEFIASRQRYYDAISTAYGVPESIWNRPRALEDRGNLL